MRKFTLLCAAAAFAAPTAIYAQQITSRIEGQVVDEAGAPLANAAVTITDTRTGETRDLVTGSEGYFSGEGLTVGGPYTVAASANGFQGQTVEGLSTSLQSATTLRFSLSPATADGSPIVVTAQRANVQLRAIGPGLAFGTEVLENVPSFSNDIRDVLRIDPRVSLDRVFETDRISCLGGNERTNTFTVDGQVQADVVGLNGTPFASRSVTPLPYDAIRETSVEFAPFDVQYGQFTGCAVNVVSKSGTNQIHGSGFFTYHDDSLIGKELEGAPVTIFPFKEYRWGATLGGPIIKDRLFIFGAYEESKTPDPQLAGPAGGGFSTELPFVTVAQFDEISQVIKDVYGFDTGGIARTLPESSRRYFGRADWLITDDHRLELTYQQLKETDVGTSDFNTGSNGVLTGFNSFLNRGTSSKYYSGRLYSQWNENLSTEVRVSHARVRDIQNPVGESEATAEVPQPRIVVGVQNNGLTGSVVSGPPFFQSANDLYTEVTQGKFLMNFEQEAHKLTFGVEFNHADVFNLFVRNATGALIFQNVNDLRNGILSGGTVSSATASNNPNGAAIANGTAAGAFGSFSATGDIDDAAAAFKRTIYSVYAQDEWQATDALRLQGGVRVDWTDGGAPGINPEFQRRYGYSNRIPFSKLDFSVLPRLAATYDLDGFGLLGDTQLRAGVGIFSGGDPAVYFSNAFSNTGAQTGFASSTVAGCNAVRVNGRIDVVQNGKFTGFPQCVIDAAQTEGAKSLGRTESTDPNLKNPSVVRANLGLASTLDITGGGGFLDGWRLNLDYIFSRYRNPFLFVDLAQTVNPALGLNGYTVDGRPIYRGLDPTRAGCAAQLVQNADGPAPVYTNLTPACFSTARNQEMQLTNGRSYSSHAASILLSKRFNGGLFTSEGSTFTSFGYAWSDADGIALNDDATGANNFTRNAAFDRQNPEVGTSTYETKHNFTFATSFANEFIGDLETRLGFVFVARAGRPYNYVFDTDGFSFSDNVGNDNEALYVPTGPGDPKVVYRATAAIGTAVPARTAAQNEEAYNAYIDGDKCLAKFRGQVVPRGACRNDWYYDLDLQFSQELPAPLANDKLRVLVNFDNFLNFLDSDLNLFKRKRASFQNVPIVGLSGVDTQGRYLLGVFNPFDGEQVQNNGSGSLWRIQFGVRYNF